MITTQQTKEGTSLIKEGLVMDTMWQTTKSSFLETHIDLTEDWKEIQNPTIYLLVFIIQ